MKSYFDWLSSGDNTLYFFITWFLLGSCVFILVEIAVFIFDTIEKNAKVEKLEEQLKKMEDINNEK